MMNPLDAKKYGSRNGGPSFSFQNRLVRLFWRITWFCTCRYTPVALHRWRIFVLSIFGANVDYSARIYPSVDVWYPKNLVVGKYSVIGPGVICYCMDTLTLKDHVVVSQRVHLCGGTHLLDDPYFQLVAKPITIESNAWVASEAFVGPNVIVGEGAVVGARAVVFKNIEKWTVVVGNPARPVKKRKQWEIAE